VAADIVSHLRISDVCRALGIEPQRGRISAPWRETRDRNVSLNDSAGLYCDHVDGDRGGGILDFVSRVRSCSRRDALRWCADLAGVPIDDTPLSAADRAHWAQEKRAIERDLPAARYWRRAAVALTEELLCVLKSQIFDPLEKDPPTIVELKDLTAMLASLQRFGDSALVAEYRAWRDREPGLTAGMVYVMRLRERAEVRAVLRYLNEATA
jgi:hypothetical protein